MVTEQHIIPAGLESGLMTDLLFHPYQPANIHFTEGKKIMNSLRNINFLQQGPQNVYFYTHPISITLIHNFYNSFCCQDYMKQCTSNSKHLKLKKARHLKLCITLLQFPFNICYHSPHVNIICGLKIHIILLYRNTKKPVLLNLIWNCSKDLWEILYITKLLQVISVQCVILYRPNNVFYVMIKKEVMKIGKHTKPLSSIHRTNGKNPYITTLIY